MPLIAIGAILKFAVTTSVSGNSLATMGVVLMVVGIVGLVISLVLASTARRTDVVHHSAPGAMWSRRGVTTHASDGVG